MDFYYQGDRFYRKKQSHADMGKSLLHYSTNGSWNPMSIDSDIEKIEIYKHFRFKKWVVLKKSEGSWLQDGPFSSEEIFLKLQSSELKPETHIWKKGFKKWVQIQNTDEFSGIYKDKDFEPSYELLSHVQELKQTPKGAEEKILDSVSFALKNYDFADIPVHLEAKSIRTLPRQSTFVYRDRVVGSRKRSLKNVFIFTSLLALIMIVIYVFLA